MEVLTFLVDAALPLLAVIVVAHLLHAKRYLEFLAVVVAAVLSYLVEFGIQQVYVRDRPFVVLGVDPLVAHSASPSFPSTHAALTMILLLAAWYHNPKLAKALLILAIPLLIARVVAHLHYTSDIFGGLVVGGVCFFLTQGLVARK